MRILFLTESLFKLGPNQSLVELATGLSDQNHEVHIAALSSELDEIHRFRDSQFSVHELGSAPVTHPFSRNSFQSVFRFQQLIRSLKPDVIHSWCGIAELIALAATQIRELVDSGHHVARLATELYIQPGKRLTRQIYENRISQGFHKVIVPHESVKRHLIDEGYNGNCIETIANQSCGLRFDRVAGRQFLLDELKLPSDSKFAGVVAPLLPRSRLKDLVWACDLLKVIRNDVHLIIIGKGSQLWRLKRFASQTEAFDHCHFVGEPNDADKMLAGIDFYWHSHVNEPLPINMMNAMRNGIPAISVYGGGTSEIIRHQETGFAVNFGARDEFARWTKYLLEIPDQGKKLADQGQAFIERNFSKTDFVDRYNNLYMETKQLAKSAS